MTENTEVNARLTRSEKKHLKGRMQNLLMFLPNMVKLCFNLLRDSRVPTSNKALFVGAIVYALMPLDLIPDVLPFVGQIDDTYLIALTLLRLVNQTDENVVREHWEGGGDIISLTDSVAKIAPMLLPRRVSRVLTSRVEMSDVGETLKGMTKDRKPLMTEVRAEENRSIK